jgi:hypothetical protein
MKLSDVLGWNFPQNTGRRGQVFDYVKEKIVAVYKNTHGEIVKRYVSIQGPCPKCGSDFFVSGARKQKSCSNSACPERRMKFSDIGDLKEIDVTGFFNSMKENGIRGTTSVNTPTPEIDEENMRDSFDMGGARPPAPSEGSMCRIEIRTSVYGTKYILPVPDDKTADLDSIIGLTISGLKNIGEFEKEKELRLSYSGFTAQYSSGVINEKEFMNNLGMMIEQFVVVVPESLYQRG